MHIHIIVLMSMHLISNIIVVAAGGGMSAELRSEPPSPGLYFWLYPVFEAVGYGEIQRDTARYARIRLDTVGYSGIQWIYCKMARYRGGTAGYQGCGVR